MNNLATLFEEKERLRSPESYFHGVSLDQELLPDNLVCFMHDYSLLNQSATQYCFHHRFFIVFPVKGEGVLGVGRNFFKLKPGRAMLVFPFQLHFFPAIEKDAEWLILSFESSDRWLTSLKDKVVKVDSEFIEKGAEAALLYLSTIKNEEGDSLKLVEIYRDLLKTLLVAPASDDEQEFSPKWEKAYRIMRKIDAFVEANIQGDISATAIAEHFKLAKNYLAALFKSNFGITLGQYVTSLKVQKATELLLNTEMQMVEIAEAAGFDNPVSFNRAFKRLMRFPPGKYRSMFSK